MAGKRESGAMAILVAILVLASFLCACSTDEVRKVNEAVLTARRRSSTTERSLELARKSRALLAQKRTDYRIGGGDVLEISIYGLEKMGEFKTIPVRVEESGTISLPVLPPIHASGLTASELERKISDLLVSSDFIKEPRISVIVTEFRSRNIAVFGAVNVPGEYTIRRNVVTLYEALALAGGPSGDAGCSLFVVRGGDGESLEETPGGGSSSGEEGTITVDLPSLLKEGDMDLNVVLRDGDVVYVPEADYFYVIGFVKKPGGFPMSRPMRVLDGIALAEGLIPKEASPRHCALKRIEGDREVVLPLDLVAIAEGDEPNFYLRPDDIIDVRQTSLRFWVLEIYDYFRSMFHIGFTYRLDHNR